MRSYHNPIRLLGEGWRGYKWETMAEVQCEKFIGSVSCSQRLMCAFILVGREKRLLVRTVNIFPDPNLCSDLNDVGLHRNTPFNDYSARLNT